MFNTITTCHLSHYFRLKQCSPFLSHSQVFHLIFVIKYVTVLSGKYPANFTRIPDSAIRIRHIPTFFTFCTRSTTPHLQFSDQLSFISSYYMIIWSQPCFFYHFVFSTISTTPHLLISSFHVFDQRSLISYYMSISSQPCILHLLCTTCVVYSITPQPDFWYILYNLSLFLHPFL